MDAAWILLVWLVAVAAAYFAVTYWTRMAAMRRRLFQGFEHEPELEVESGERESRVARWLMLAGIGGWLGYLLLSRLVLLIDRLAFLLGDWLGLLS